MKERIVLGRDSHTPHATTWGRIAAGPSLWIESELSSWQEELSWLFVGEG